MTEAFTNSMESLVGNSNLLGIIYRCTREQSHRIKLEAFALLGDLCPYCMPHIVGNLQAYMSELLKTIAPKPGRASSNACWALSMIMRYSNDKLIEPFASEILRALACVLSSDKLTKELMENAAIALGWLGNRAPGIVAQNLDKFFQNWCFALIEIVEAEEKTYAYFGLCKAVETNPSAIFNENLRHLFTAIGAWDEPCDELRSQFKHILGQFKQSAPPNEWAALMSSVNQMLQTKLRVNYGI